MRYGANWRLCMSQPLQWIKITWCEGSWLHELKVLLWSWYGWRCGHKKIYLWLHMYSRRESYFMVFTVALNCCTLYLKNWVEASKEAIWLALLCSELGLLQQISELHYDAENAICLAKNPVYYGRTKHIDILCHFIREVIRGRYKPTSKDWYHWEPGKLFNKVEVQRPFTLQILPVSQLS